MSEIKASVQFTKRELHPTHFAPHQFNSNKEFARDVGMLHKELHGKLASSIIGNSNDMFELKQEKVYVCGVIQTAVMRYAVQLIVSMVRHFFPIREHYRIFKMIHAAVKREYERQLKNEEEAPF